MSNPIYKSRKIITPSVITGNEPSYDALEKEFRSVINFLVEKNMTLEWTFWKLDNEPTHEDNPKMPELSVEQIEDLTADLHIEIVDHMTDNRDSLTDSLEDRIRNVLMENFEPVEE